MVKKRKAEQGSALFYLFALCLLLSAIIAALTEKIKLNRILNNRLEQELTLSQVAEDLTELAVAHLLSNRDDYDAPRHFSIPQAKIQDLARGYPAQVEIRDEGSCFNPNNLPVACWEDYLRNEPQLYEQLVNWYFFCSTSQSASLGDSLSFLPFPFTNYLTHIFLHHKKGTHKNSGYLIIFYSFTSKTANIKSPSQTTFSPTRAVP